MAIASSIPLLRPLVKTRGKATHATYELPRYAVRSGQTDSSAFSNSKLGRVRTSVRGPLSPRSAGFDDDSEEGILVAQGSEIRNHNTKILVKQEYTVTRESRDADSIRGWSAAHGEKDMGLGREPSTESETDHREVRKDPQPPSSAWVREKRG